MPDCKFMMALRVPMGAVEKCSHKLVVCKICDPCFCNEVIKWQDFRREYCVMVIKPTTKEK